MSQSLNWDSRLEAIKVRKSEQVQWKLKMYGRTMDTDDKGIEPPPEGYHFNAKSNHPSGGIFGAKACGSNFRAFLENHPVCIDPMNSLAGGWVDRFDRARQPSWHPDIPYTDLLEDLKQYDIVSGIGATQHFTPDIRIGFRLGWQGILDNIRKSRAKLDESHADFLDGLADIVLGIQNIISRHADMALSMAETETRPEIRENLLEMARINRKLVTDPPMSFREACQYTAWQIVTFDMYNGAGAALGSIDVFLKHYYDNDKHAGLLDDEEAVFHLCCLFLKDNTYYQIGGSDKYGNDRTNELSFLLLEAMHRLKIPVSLCVRVHDQMNPKLLERAVQILFEDRMGQPNFLGDKSANDGFMRMGYPLELAVDREKSGCHWNAIPGREYTLNDCVKINFAKVFEVALQEMLGKDQNITSSDQRNSEISMDVTFISKEISINELNISSSSSKNIDTLWQIFSRHLECAVLITAKGLDFQMAHMHEVFPELAMDLLCYGPVERGLDATNGGVEFVNLCVDGAGLAVVADSFAALEQRVEKDKMLSWEEVSHLLTTDYQDAEVQRLMLKSVSRYGSGNSQADAYAVRITEHFCDLVREKTTPAGFQMIPGLFSWANTIPMGKAVGATPNGRHAGQPISHGANPEPGFRESGAMTAMAVAVASVQCGYGNSVPIQLEVDPLEGASETGRKTVEDFLRTYCNDLGGSLVNLNILDRETLLDAHRDPDKYPNLIVKVTGFSAYFATLSDSFRQLVVDRLLTGL